MGGGQSEPMETISFAGLASNHMRPTHARETYERDPLITSKPKNTRLRVGQTPTFSVEYEAVQGPVTIIFSTQDVNGYPFKNSPVTMDNCPRISTFSFDISKATVRHSGKYTVMICDESVPKRDGANPTSASWTVKVTGDVCQVL